MSNESTARIVVRALGLVLIGTSLAGILEMLARPDPFAGVADLPREFEKLRDVLSMLKAQLDAWSLVDGVVRAVALGLGLYLLFGGALVVRLLCRGLTEPRAA